MFDTYTLILAQGDAPPPPSSDTNGNGGTNTTTEQQPGGVTPGPDGKDGRTKPQGFGLMEFLPFILIIVVFWVLIMGGQRREKKKRKQMLEQLKKNDKVVTIGGILGTVVEIRDNEVVLKVDESSNTRMRFSRSAIQGVVGQED